MRASVTNHLRTMCNYNSSPCSSLFVFVRFTVYVCQGWRKPGALRCGFVGDQQHHQKRCPPLGDEWLSEPRQHTSPVPCARNVAPFIYQCVRVQFWPADPIIRLRVQQQTAHALSNGHRVRIVLRIVCVMLLGSLLYTHLVRTSGDDVPLAACTKAALKHERQRIETRPLVIGDRLRVVECVGVCCACVCANDVGQ